MLGPSTPLAPLDSCGLTTIFLALHFPTFQHLYQWNAFDTLLPAPYFVVMVSLAFYEVHHYQLVGCRSGIAATPPVRLRKYLRSCRRPSIEYNHRGNRYGYKAGALGYRLHTPTGEFVAIFDADFVPAPDWVMQVVHHFAGPHVSKV